MLSFRRIGSGMIAGLLGICLAGTAGAALSGPFTDSISLQTTDWNSAVSIPKFDPSLGTLNSIKLTISGHVEGGARFESLDAQPTTVQMFLQSSLTLQRPDLSTLVITVPVVNTTDSVAMFDGVMDFAGASGKTYASLAGDSSDTVISPLPLSDLVLFTGPGNISLPVKAVGLSYGAGTGNLLLNFNTKASADVSVTYEYTPVPEPASLSLLAMGALGLLRRRRGV